MGTFPSTRTAATDRWLPFTGAWCTSRGVVEDTDPEESPERVDC